jgi:hypothetical protein
MEDSARDRISEAFGDLTDLLEDAAGLEVEGQSRRRPVAELRGITVRFRLLLNASERMLCDLERVLTGEADDQEP